MTPRKCDFTETKKKIAFSSRLENGIFGNRNIVLMAPEKGVLSRNEESLLCHPEKAIFWKQINRFLHGALKSDFSENDKSLL